MHSFCVKCTPKNIKSDDFRCFVPGCGKPGIPSRFRHSSGIVDAETCNTLNQSIKFWKACGFSHCCRFFSTIEYKLLKEERFAKREHIKFEKARRKKALKDACNKTCEKCGVVCNSGAQRAKHKKSKKCKG